MITFELLTRVHNLLSSSQSCAPDK